MYQKLKNNLIKALTLAVCVYSTAATAESIILSQSNTVVIRGPISHSNVSTAQLDLFEKSLRRGVKKYPIYIVLDSPGGSISAGLDFIEFAKTVRNVHTITLFAASMASAIAQHLPGDRLVTDFAVMMFHRAAGSFSGQFEMGEVEARLGLAKRMVLILENKNASRLGLKLKAYKAKVVNEYWLFGSDILADNAADRRVNVVCTPALIKSRTVVSSYTIFGNSQQAYSGCPLFRSAITE